MQNRSWESKSGEDFNIFKPVLLLDPIFFWVSFFPPQPTNPTSPGPQVNEAKAKRVRSTAKGVFCVGDSGGGYASEPLAVVNMVR